MHSYLHRVIFASSMKISLWCVCVWIFRKTIPKSFIKINGVCMFSCESVHSKNFLIKKQWTNWIKSNFILKSQSDCYEMHRNLIISIFPYMCVCACFYQESTLINFIKRHIRIYCSAQHTTKQMKGKFLSK